MAISVVIADDHRMFRQGLRSVLDEDSDIRVIGEAEKGSQAFELCGEPPPLAAAFVHCRAPFLPRGILSPRRGAPSKEKNTNTWW